MGILAYRRLQNESRVDAALAAIIVVRAIHC
jgi:hypothetical protein